MIKLSILIEESAEKTCDMGSEQAYHDHAVTVISDSEADVSGVETGGVSRIKTRVDCSDSPLDNADVWVRNYGIPEVYHRLRTCGKAPSNKHRKLRLSRAVARGLR